jgi:hypothetical protein
MNKYVKRVAFATLVLFGFCGAIVGLWWITKGPAAKQITLVKSEDIPLTPDESEYFPVTLVESKDIPATLVQSKDIPKSVKIVGTLGEPLGNLLLIRGTWIKAGQVGKGIEPDLQVTEVNGKPLAQTVLLAGMLVNQFLPDRKGGKSSGAEVWDWRQGEGDEPAPKPVAGQTWELLGVQHGSFNDRSPEAVKAFTGVPTQVPMFLSGFVTPFKYIAMRKVKMEQ